MRARKYNRILSDVLKEYGLVHVYTYSNNGDDVSVIHSVEEAGSGNPEWRCFAYVTEEHGKAVGKSGIHYSLERGSRLVIEETPDVIDTGIAEKLREAEQRINSKLELHMIS